MNEQPTGTRGQLARVQARQWPQYKKFSATRSVREVIARTLTGAAIVGLVAYTWTCGDRMEPPPDMHVVTYVEFPRVTIVGKRVHASEATMARKTDGKHQRVDPASIELVKSRD